MSTTIDWERDPRLYSFEDRIKHTLVPPGLYLRNLAWRRRRKGEKELRLLGSLVDPGRVAIDVGANKGVYTWYLSRLSREVMAFEPHPKVYRILARGVPANVRTFDVALSNRSGPAELIVPIQHSGRFANQGGTLFDGKLNDDKPFVTAAVTQKRLDEYGFKDVSFIKIDVEGFELQVLEGAADTLARERPVLLVEIDELHSKRPVADAVATVRDYGYDCYYVSRTSLSHFSRFETDSAKTRTDNFVFLPVG
jgi:FkbM family methyltransferase